MDTRKPIKLTMTAQMPILKVTGVVRLPYGFAMTIFNVGDDAEQTLNQIGLMHSLS